MLNLSTCFANIHTPDDRGLTPLLLACSYGALSFDPDILEFLLKRGAKINDRDLFGNTCLHLYLYGDNWDYCGDVRVACRVLILLLRHGADIHAINDDGISVSERAYTRRGNSASGDVWDRALVEEGYRVCEFRRGWPREANFTDYYLKEHFERLWDGIEHLCPYYDSVGLWWSCLDGEERNRWDDMDVSEEEGSDNGVGGVPLVFTDE